MTLTFALPLSGQIQQTINWLYFSFCFFFFFFYQEMKFDILCNWLDDLHEKSNLIFWEKQEKYSKRSLLIVSPCVLSIKHFVL